MGQPLGRSIVAAAAAVLAIGLTTGPAIAAPDVHVAGAGTVTFDGSDSRLTVAARGTLTDATGHIRLQTPDFDVDVAVTCLDVVGDTANVSGRLPPGIAVEPHELLVTIVDNGNSDLAGVRSVTGAKGCAAVTPVSPVQQGNFVVNGP